MEKRIYLFVTFLSLLFFNMQVSAQKADIVREGVKLFIVERGQKYDIDPTILLAKIKNDNRQLKNRVKPLFIDNLGIARIPVPDSLRTEDYKDFLEKSNEYEFVEYNIVYPSCSFLPNDVGIYYQWYLDKINAYNAWTISKGSSDVKVAVIDGGGISCSHPDIGFGTDGYTNINISEGYNYVNSTITHSPTNNHGTMVAGIISAKTNNVIGIAGIAGGNYSAGSIIIPYQTGGLTSFIVSAINDAVDKGANVINMSFGGSYSSSIESAIQNAYNHGVTMVCSTGNNNSPYLLHPASSQYTIAVGATNKSDQRASFSNYGAGIDLVAPGDSIYSTSYNATNNINTYTSFWGTSFAAPQVTGTIALMLSVNPSLTPNKIRDILKKSAYKINGYTYTNGWNQYVGYGLLNSYESVINSIVIYGPSSFCNTATYFISNLPAGASVTWNTSFMSITSGQGTSSITVQKEYDGLGWITAKIYLNGEYISTCSLNDIGVGTPPLDLFAYPVGPNGELNTWDFTYTPNTFVVDDVVDQFYSYYQVYVYKQNGNSWTQVAYLPHAISGYTSIPYYGTNGWFKMVIRGYGQCGFSDWWEQEVLATDTNNFDSMNLLTAYNPSSQIVSIKLLKECDPEKNGRGQLDNFETTDNYTIQLWEGSRMVKSICTNQKECQLSMTGMRDGVYLVRVISENKCYAGKFMKK